jgi:hypothetical protein
MTIRVTITNEDTDPTHRVEVETHETQNARQYMSESIGPGESIHAYVYGEHHLVVRENAWPVRDAEKERLNEAFKAAQKAVAPLVAREKEAENVTADIMDFRLK